VRAAADALDAWHTGGRVGPRPQRVRRAPAPTPVPPRTDRRRGARRAPGRAGAPRLVKREREGGRGTEREPDEAGPMVRLFVGAGRKAGIRPGDLVGAITGEAGVTSKSVGAIEIADNFSLVEVPASLVDDIIGALKATMIRGQKVNVRRERTT